MLNENNFQNNYNSETGTFQGDSYVRVPLVANNNDVIQNVFRRSHQEDKLFSQRRFGYLPLLIPQNDNGKYKIDSRPSPLDPQKVRIEITIVLEDEDFRKRAFEAIKEKASQDPNMLKFDVNGLDIYNVSVLPIYDLRFDTFDHDGIENTVNVTKTRNYLPNTQGHPTITLHIEVDKKAAEDILKNPEQIVIACSYTQTIVQQKRNTTIASIGDIAKSKIYADLKQQASGKFIKRNDRRELLNTLATEINIYSEMDQPEGYQDAVNVVIERIMGIFEQRSEAMYENTQAFLNAKLLSDKDFQADILTGEVHKTEDTSKMHNEFNSKSAGSSGKGILHTFKSVLNPIGMVKDAVSGFLGNDTNSNSSDTGLKNSMEKTTKRENSWTGEKITPKDIVLVTDLLHAMEQNISLSHTGVSNDQSTNRAEKLIVFKNFDYTPKVEPPKVEPPQAPPSIITETAKNINLELIRVDGGIFKMGGQDNEVQESEKPAHEVEVDTFYIGKYPVTQAQWRAIMNNNPSHFRGDSLPVEMVSWEDAIEFCHRLSDLTGKNYRLPTEAEWEYAARGGNKSRGYKYAGSNNIDTVAWYEQKGGATTRPVGQKNPNELGLYDMSGNVWEWCQDWYDAKYYHNSPRENPKGPDSGTRRVLRGGSWSDGAVGCRVAVRNSGTPADRYSLYGFRLLFVP